MIKTRLLTPGPTQIPERVLAQFGKPIIHHRTPAFEELFKGVREDLRYLFQTRSDVLCLAATGTGAMDAAVSNLFSPGDTVIVLNCGKFGERWTQIARAYGLEVAELVSAPGVAPTLDEIKVWAAKHPKARAILFQASETSTGTRLPTQEICAWAKSTDILTVCDAITACGVFELPMDAWGIDVLITGSQKALMIPPGVAMIALSDRAWKRTESSKLPRYYFDLRQERKAQAKNQTAWTPAISLIQGLSESLHMIREEGLETLFKRTDQLARATRAGTQALGFKTLAAASPSPAVTAAVIPAEIRDGKKMPGHMRDRYGVTLAGGQDELEGKILRFSHFGYCDRFDIVTALSCLELTLKDFGAKVQFGRGVGAALEILGEG